MLQIALQISLQSLETHFSGSKEGKSKKETSVTLYTTEFMIYIYIYLRYVLLIINRGGWCQQISQIKKDIKIIIIIII